MPNFREVEPIYKHRNLSNDLVCLMRGNTILVLCTLFRPDNGLIKPWCTTISFGWSENRTHLSWWYVYWLCEVLPIIYWSDVISHVFSSVQLTRKLHISKFWYWNFREETVRLKILFEETSFNRGLTVY